MIVTQTCVFLVCIFLPSGDYILWDVISRCTHEDEIRQVEIYSEPFVKLRFKIFKIPLKKKTILDIIESSLGESSCDFFFSVTVCLMSNTLYF